MKCHSTSSAQAVARQDRAGSVTIEVEMDGSQVNGARINNQRLAGALPALTGTPLADLPGQLERLFPVCALAHRIAARRAIEALVGYPPERTLDRRRERVLLAESAATQIWRATLDWPELLGRNPRNVDLVACARRELKLCRAKGALSGHQAQSLADALSIALFGDFNHDRTIDFEGLIEHLDRTNGVASSLLNQATQPRFRSAKTSHPPLTANRQSAAWFGQRIFQNRAFGLRPDMNGQPAECGAIGELDEQQHDRIGPRGPLAARFLAMVWQGVCTTRLLLDDVDCEEDTQNALTAASPASGWGMGLASTARGPLACLIGADGQWVCELSLCAPSEWNLHPDGALAGLLSELSGERAGDDARLTVAAFDPCAEIRIQAKTGACISHA